LKALSLVNDVGVDPAYLANLILDLEAVFDRHHLVAAIYGHAGSGNLHHENRRPRAAVARLAIYGHAGSGNLHLRPLFDVTTSDLPALLIRVADEVYGAVLRYDGTITAEHGMGHLRMPYLAQEWSEAILGYMRRVKEVFDPDDLLNPDVIFSARALTDDLRPIAYQ